MLLGHWFAGTTSLWAQPPSVVDNDLVVRTVVTGLDAPIGMAFLGAGDFFVLEKNTGRVKRVIGGVQSTVLDLAVNNNSERGLLGIALHARFPADPGVYLYWTCRSSVPLDSNEFRPEEQECPNTPALGADSVNVLEVPLQGNRVDRFVWNGSSLLFDRNLAKLRAFQHDGGPTPAGQGDETQPARGNHNGGVIRFGPDGKPSWPGGPMLACDSSHSHGREPQTIFVTNSLVFAARLFPAPRATGHKQRRSREEAFQIRLEDSSTDSAK